MTPDGEPDQPPPRPMDRRSLVGLTGAAVATGAIGATAVAAGLDARRSQQDAPQSATDRANAERLAAVDASVSPGDLPFGLAHRVPAFGQVLSFDLTPEARSSASTARQAAVAFLQRTSSLLRGEDPSQWSVAGAGLSPANLQVTPGIGASLLEACELSGRRPAGLVDLPRFAADRLQERLSGGDLMVQIGAEDPMKLAGRVQWLLSGLPPGVQLRWSRSGFSATAAAQQPPAPVPRNLQGHPDGIANPELRSPLWDATVRVREPGWMLNGSYLVVRVIRINLRTWFSEPVGQRDRVIGRRTSDGAPLGGTKQDDSPDFSATDSSGRPVIPADAHIRLANPTATAGARIYRRPWHFDDGFDADGVRQAGQLFLAWQSDLEQGFIAIQRSLEKGQDHLLEYLTHYGSAVFAVPAANADGYPGQELFES